MEDTKNKFEITYRNVDELVEPDYNPRKITAKQKEDIRKSIERFGFVQPIVVNVNPDRKDIVIGGNQRLKIAKGMGIETVPCYEVNLNETDEKELNLRLNKNQAEFDIDMLRTYFDKQFLFDVGFSEKEIGRIESEFEKKFNAVTNDNCEMPIVAQFNERYDTVMIFCNNELDFNWMRNVLNLKPNQDYKNSKVGEAHVMTVQEFQQIWEEAMGDDTDND